MPDAGPPSARRHLLWPPWMDRNLRLVWSARLVMSVGRALAGVVTALYLADRGLSAVGIALVFMVVALASALLSSLSGLLSDRVGRKPFLVVFPLLTAAAGLVFALARPLALLVVFAALGSFGRGAGAGAGAVGPYQAVESALATESVRAGRRNDVFGRLAFASSLGALAGGLLADLAHRHHGALGAVIAAYRPAFLAVAACSALAGLLALWIREPARTTGGDDVPVPRGKERRGGMRWPARSVPLLVRLWATNTVNGVAVGMFGPFVSYWFALRYHVGPGEIGALFAVVNLATLPTTLEAAGLARRFGIIRAMTALRLAQAVLLVPMVLSPSFLLAGAIYLVRMAAQRAALPLRQSYVLAMAHPEERASVAALSNLPSQLAMGVSPLASGYLLEEVSLSLPFELAGLLQALNAGLYWLFFRHAAPEEERARSARTGSGGAVGVGLGGAGDVEAAGRAPADGRG
ncbi:MFS transporter [Aciditerrimonas ferrireducens]|uniref:MFS transporter n=1 Tax=Aciditerrimonas ferrireducens TaxID=667306 RepID=UPI0020050AE6|nr:MFS transporter [Aciditerrimonas ferrireducens]MCK4176643.1 MFS transporter [Aciditerrimonas ferrireducens]